VEKLSGEPSHGEVPGTEAYDKRAADATPDEIAVVSPPQPESSSTGSEKPIPKTVVDQTDDIEGSTTHHYHKELHKADAVPDIVRKPDGTGEANPIPSSVDTTKETSGTTTNSS
jgi:hypothetical protein